MTSYYFCRCGGFLIKAAFCLWSAVSRQHIWFYYTTSVKKSQFFPAHSVLFLHPCRFQQVFFANSAKEPFPKQGKTIPFCQKIEAAFLYGSANCHYGRFPSIPFLHQMGALPSLEYPIFSQCARMIFIFFSKQTAKNRKAYLKTLLFTTVFPSPSLQRAMRKAAPSALPAAAAALLQMQSGWTFLQKM